MSKPNVAIAKRVHFSFDMRVSQLQHEEADRGKRGIIGPSMAERPNPNKAIRDFIQTPEAAQGWAHADRARDLYEYARIISTAFFSPRDESQKPMPDVLVAIDKLPRNVLGAFHLAPDGLGLRHKVSMNAAYIDRPVWEQLETLVHELGHVYVNDVVGHKDSHNYHSQEFVELMADIGITVKPKEGYHLKPASGQFAQLMEWLDVSRPAQVEEGNADKFVLPPGSKNWWDGDRGGSRGSSTLFKFIADECTRRPQCSARLGRKDMLLKCLACDGVLHPVE